MKPALDILTSLGTLCIIQFRSTCTSYNLLPTFA